MGEESKTSGAAGCFSRDELVAGCLSRDELAAFNLGRLLGGGATAAAAHIEGCESCLALLRELDGDADSLLRDLRRVAPADVPGDTGPDLGLTPPQGPGGAAGPREGQPLDEDLPAVPGYEVGGELGRGGMGVVLRAYDPDFRRPLAVKVLQARHWGRPGLARRFLDEAVVTGQLQHPGVPPVHDLGRLGDGRPFFAMKLVEGRTLAELLGRRRGPADELPRYLHVFEQVCQTLAYAHSRGVVHRDLKPANVMVGEFGEVQVMDWGLAKVRERGPAEAPPVGSAVHADWAEPGGPLSQEGDVMGTPAYMAPEQARGEVDLVDERSDVFGLGAILCEVLTGRPPYGGSTSKDVLGAASRGDLAGAFARLGACGADPELVGLARRCLAPQREGRPRGAGEVAQAVAAYQAGVQERLRQAEVERARAEEARKRRRLRASLAAAVLGLAAVGAGTGLWLRWQHARDKAAVQTALGRAGEHLEGWRWAEAEATLDQAESQMGWLGTGRLRRRLAQAREDLRLARRLDDIRLGRATLVNNKLDLNAADRAYLEAFREEGLAEEGEDPAAVAERVRESAVRKQLVAALDDWAGATRDESRRAWVLEVARRADPDPWRDRARDPKVWQDREALERLAREAEAAGLSPQLAHALAAALRSSGEDPAPVLRAAQERHPNDFWLNFELGRQSGKNLGQAIGYYRAALAVRPSANVVYNNLGIALHLLKDPVSAVAALKEATRRDPTDAVAHNNLGHALLAVKRWDEAVAALRKAVKLNPEYDAAYHNLGLALCERGEFPEARGAFRRCLDLLLPGHPHRRRTVVALQECERLLALDQKLAAVLAGRARPATPAEGLQLAWLCWQPYKQLYAATARLSADAFREKPELAEQIERFPRYNAACAAVLAAAGRDKDAGKLGEEERARLRRQALDWLQADLKTWAERAKKRQSHPTVRWLMQNCYQADADLASVRDAKALGELPEAERQAWQRLWREAGALRKQVQ